MHPIAYFYPEGHEAHAHPGHPERPERVEAVVRKLRGAGLWDPFPVLTPLEVPEPVLLGVHERKHLDVLRQVSELGGHYDGDTFMTGETWPLAQKAAGGACAVAAAVWERRAAAGFALCRPPGHHATPSAAMGFCMVNNIAVAAEYLLREHGAGKIAVVDIDLHHGNGTQDIFYNRGDVFFTSIHQHPLYPGTGMLNETGAGPGEGATLNIPLPPFSGDRAFAKAMRTAILPALRRFEPEMILVSAGMDAHWRDPLGHLLLTAGGYHEAIRSLRDFADQTCEGRITLVLEGGYDLTGGSSCAAGAVTALLERPFADDGGPAPHRETDEWVELVERVKEIHGL